MAIKLSTAARSARMDATGLNAYIGASAQLKIFSGTRPANPAAAITGTLLATLTCNAGGFGTNSSGVLTASAITSGTGTAGAGAGTTATHFRMFKSDGTTVVMDGDVGISGSDLNLDNTSIATGQTVACSSFAITDGNA